MATILIADDDAKLLKMVRRTLVYEGFDVITATNGRETLDQIEAKNPDLLILDWMMPELDGIEVLARLRGANDEIPVLMLTARDTVENRVEGLNRGPTITWASLLRLLNCWRG
jgi:two-component system response regulator MprA